jgi:hypothetical protein
LYRVHNIIIGAVGVPACTLLADAYSGFLPITFHVMSILGIYQPVIFGTTGNLLIVWL